MLDQLFLAINSLMTESFAIAALGCFLWGVVSVLFSPCHLASIPLIVGYVAGQGKIIQGKQAAKYALTFSFGLFVTIAAIGVICSLLGRLLGDVGPYWTILVGAILLWVALDMLGVAKCSVSSGLLGRFRVKGIAGALFLGLAYGVLSGSCTFGFIAPILAIITIQEKMLTGMVLIVLFAIGHCPSHRGRRKFHCARAALVGERRHAARRHLVSQKCRDCYRVAWSVLHSETILVRMKR